MSFDESKKIISSLAAPHEYQSKNKLNSNIIIPYLNTKTNYYFQIFKREKIVCFFRKFIFIRLLFIIHLYFRLLHYTVFKSSGHFVRHSNSNIKYNLILFVMTLINRMDILTASTKVLLPPSTSTMKEFPENLFHYDNTTNHNYTSTMPSLMFVRLLNESAISSAVRTRKEEDDNNNNNNLLQQSPYSISFNFVIPSISPPTYNGSLNAADTQLPSSPFSPFIIVDGKNTGGSSTGGLLIDSIHESGGKSKKSATHLPLRTAEEDSSNISYIKVKTAPQKVKFYETANFREFNSTNPSPSPTLVLMPEAVAHENVETSTTSNTHFLSTDTITYNYYYYLKSKLVTNSPTLTARPPPAPLVKTIEDFIDVDYFDYIEPDDWFLNIPPLQATTAASATKIPSDLNIIMPFNTSNYYVTTTNTIKTTAVFDTSTKNIPPPPKQQNQAPPKAQNYLSWVQHQKSHNTTKNLTSSSPPIKNNVTPTMDHHNKTRKNLNIHKLVIGALINVSSTYDVVTITTTTPVVKSSSQKPTFMLHNHCSNRHVQIFGRRINAKASQFTRQRYKYANLYAEASDTAGQIRLRSARTGYYVCFDKQARLLARLRPNKSLCDFVEIYHNRFFKYRSVYVPVWYMGFDLTGHPLPGITHDAKYESNDKCYYFIKRRNIQKYHVLELNSSKPETLHLGKDERDYQKDEILSFSQLLPTAPKIFKTSLFSKLFGVPHRLNLVKSKNKKDEEKSTTPFKRKKQLTRGNETETFNFNSPSKHQYNDPADGEESSSADEDTYKSLFDYFSPPRTSHNKRVHSDDYPDNYNKFSTKNARVESSTTPNNKNNSLLLKWQFQKHHQQPETHRTKHQSTASDEDNNIFENYFNSPIRKRYISINNRFFN